MLEAHLVINGVLSPAGSGRTYERVDPLSNEVVTRAPAASAAEALAAANAGAAAFAEWSRTLPKQRTEVLRNAEHLLAARSDDFVEVAMQEVGSSRGWVEFNVELGCQVLRQAATLPALIRDEIVEQPSGPKSILRRQPVGVVLGFAPWNAPVTLALRAIAAPLACGNTVVLKGSELCARTHQMVVEVMNDAGLPKGVANYVTNAPEQATEIAEALIGHPAVRRINFTGSTRVGRQIAQIAAGHLKPCLLELSGNSPLIVLEDADLDAAAQAAAFGAFFNQGQICMSTDRVIVCDAVADDFAARLTRIARTKSAGDPRDGKTQLGPLINAEAAFRLRGLIERAVAQGATILTGGVINGSVMQPTVVANVSPVMRLYHEECFGPVVGILRVRDAAEAISVANDTQYGLSAAVFSRDEGRAMDVASQIESGICHINGPTVFDDPDMPFGGMKASGYGRFGGTSAINEFTEQRWIAVHNGPAPHSF